MIVLEVATTRVLMVCLAVLKCLVLFDEVLHD